MITMTSSVKQMEWLLPMKKQNVVQKSRESRLLSVWLISGKIMKYDKTPELFDLLIMIVA